MNQIFASIACWYFLSWCKWISAFYYICCILFDDSYLLGSAEFPCPIVLLPKCILMLKFDLTLIILKLSRYDSSVSNLDLVASLHLFEFSVV